MRLKDSLTWESTTRLSEWECFRLRLSEAEYFRLVSFSLQSISPSLKSRSFRVSGSSRAGCAHVLYLREACASQLERMRERLGSEDEGLTDSLSWLGSLLTGFDSFE